MGNPSAAHEPSMEEILASIRQIISEDGEQPEGGTQSSDGDNASPLAEDEGAEPEMAAAEPGHEAADEAASDSAQADDGEPTPVAAAAPARPAEAEQPRSDPTPRRQPGASQPAHPAQLSESAAQPPRPAAAAAPALQPAGQAPGAGALAASAAAVGAERRLLSPQADASVSGAFSALAHTILAQNARTLEDLVSEMLRPMLKEWLDDNLPPLVERLVKEEIERVSRGRH